MSYYPGKRGMRTESVNPDADELSSRDKALRLVRKWPKKELVAYCMFKASAGQIDAWADEYDEANE